VRRRRVTSADQDARRFRQDGQEDLPEPAIQLAEGLVAIEHQQRMPHRFGGGLHMGQGTMQSAREAEQKSFGRRLDEAAMEGDDVSPSAGGEFAPKRGFADAGQAVDPGDGDRFAGVGPIGKAPQLGFSAGECGGCFGAQNVPNSSCDRHTSLPIELRKYTAPAG